MWHPHVEVRGQLRGVGSLFHHMGSRDQTHVVRFGSRHPHHLSYLIGFFLMVVMEVVMEEVIEVVALMAEVVMVGLCVCMCLCAFAF